MDKKSLISVIVPCYKVEAYLPRCVDSILRQTYKNIEIFLVDDGSPDNCGLICDEYAKQDTRVKVIHKKNGGLSDARNVAIDIAKGEYVTFIDSDDYVSPDYLNVLYDLISKHGSDISVSSFSFFYETGKIKDHSSGITEYVCSREEALKTMFYQDKFDNSAWGKLYKSHLFGSIRYPKGKIYEDFGTTYKLLMLTNKVAYTSQSTYYYLQRSGSIDRSGFSERNLDALPLAEELLSLIDRELTACYKAAVCRCVCLYWHILLPMPKKHPRGKEVISLIRKYRWTVVFDRHSRPKARVACLCSLLGFSFSRFLFSLFSKK